MYMHMYMYMCTYTSMYVYIYIYVNIYISILPTAYCPLPLEHCGPLQWVVNLARHSVRECADLKAALVCINLYFLYCQILGAFSMQ